MIGRISGTLLEKEPPLLLVDTGGVAYEMSAPMSTFYDLPAIGEQVTLHTHLVVREDAHQLYGFSREPQRRLFRGLLRISGVGPRVALALLSGLTDRELMACIAEEDVGRITQVPGIGRKTAERLIVEMRDKIPESLTSAAGSGDQPAMADDAVSEAVRGLVALGYKPNEANRAIRQLTVKGMRSEEIIREALRTMAG